MWSLCFQASQICISVAANAFLTIKCTFFSPCVLVSGVISTFLWLDSICLMRTRVQRPLESRSPMLWPGDVHEKVNKDVNPRWQPGLLSWALQANQSRSVLENATCSRPLGSKECLIVLQFAVVVFVIQTCHFRSIMSSNWSSGSLQLPVSLQIVPSECQIVVYGVHLKISVGGPKKAV